jgi:ribosomal protein S18 acetylase RimI-like enzyme
MLGKQICLAFSHLPQLAERRVQVVDDSACAVPPRYARHPGEADPVSFRAGHTRTLRRGTDNRNGASCQTPSDLPSHLHINLVPRLQSQGLGRQLMNKLIRALREQGSVGLHFFVWPANQRAVGFYRHLGFTMISAEGPVIFAKDLRPAA